MHPANRPVRKRMGILCEKYKNLPVPKSIRIGRESPPRKNRRKTKEIERNNRKRSGILIIYRHIRRKTIGKARKASENGRNGRNDKSRPEGSLPMPQTPPAKDQRIVQSMPEQPQIGTSRPVAPVHGSGRKARRRSALRKEPFYKTYRPRKFPPPAPRADSSARRSAAGSRPHLRWNSKTFRYRSSSYDPTDPCSPNTLWQI